MKRGGRLHEKGGSLTWNFFLSPYAIRENGAFISLIVLIILNATAGPF